MLAGLFAAGATLALSGIVLLPLPDQTDVPASLAVVTVAYLAAAALFLAGVRVGHQALQGFLALGTVCVALGIHFSGDVATDNEMFFLWVALYAGYFFSRAQAVLQLLLVGASYAFVLALNPPDSAPGIRWLITMGTLVVAAELIARLTQRVEREALHDPVTGLPNRALFLDRLERGLARSRGRSFSAVLLVALDRFQLVTTSLGHESGDHLLREVAARLTACLRPEDTVGRFSEDKFAILLEQIDEPTRAPVAAERIVDRMREPFDVAGRELFLTSHVGLAFSGPSLDGARDLVRAADVAASRTADSAGSRYEVFDASMNQRASARLELLSDLRRAVESHEFEVHYQPKISLRTGRVLGMEALVRWNHPERGLLAPAEFIAAAEDGGTIVQMGRQVLRQACAQARAWQTRMPSDPPLKMFVNLSARQLQHSELVGEVGEALLESGIEPQTLELELTESVVMEDLGRTAETLRALKSLGVGLALDDFGVGYSSLGLLRRLPIDTLKIDRSFVGRMLEGPENDAIVGAIVSLAKTLRLQVVAEGVENEEQLERVRELGCDVAQGFYFARPLPAAEATRAILAHA